LKFTPRQNVYFVLATIVFLFHLCVAAVAKPTFLLTMYGDSSPCILLILGILAVRENFGRSLGILPLFWALFAGGLSVMLLSELYWFYFDWRRLTGTPSPIPGDTFFLLSNVFFLSALALRPHSAAVGRNLQIRFLDLVLLSVWWLALYGYFSLPWQIGRQDFTHYNPAYYTLACVQHLVIVVALAILSRRHTAPWRLFYLALSIAFVLIGGGNLLLSIAVNSGWYYSGSFYDTPFLLAVYLFVPIAASGSALEPLPDHQPNRELMQSVWTARCAMLAILSLPIIALLGLYERYLPAEVAALRLRLVFAAMFLLGALVYWKFNLLALELRHLVKLTCNSIEKLNAVQQQVAHSEKLVALGRLASGAAHEISNPLTAIFGYSELLTDIPALTADDRAHAQLIQHQVHHAQAAVSSLRHTLRQNAAPASGLVDKKPAS